MNSPEQPNSQDIFDQFDPETGGAKEPEDKLLRKIHELEEKIAACTDQDKKSTLEFDLMLLKKHYHPEK